MRILRQLWQPVLFLIAKFILLLTFQSCTESTYYKNESKTLNSIDNANSVDEAPPVAVEPVSPSEPVTPTEPVATPPPVEPMPAEPLPAEPIVVNPPPPVPAETCTDYLNHLGWENFSDPVQVDFYRITTFDGSSPGYELIFRGRIPHFEELYNRKFRADTSGFSIKLKNVVTNASTTVPYSSYLNNQYALPKDHNVWIVSGSFEYAQRPDLNKKNIQFQLATSTQQAGTVKAELYCFNKLVAAGTQDFRNFESFGVINNLTCPAESVGNTQVVCSTYTSSGVASVYWLINGVRHPTFSGIVLSYFPGLKDAPVAGTHTVQAIAVTADGREFRSSIKTIIIK